MKHTELNAFLRRMETMGVYFYTKDTLQRAFPNDEPIALERALGRHVSAGLIAKPARNVYASPRAGLDLACGWSAFMRFMRPMDRFHLSLETRLSELGVISQVASVITLVSSGRSNRFDTPYGLIEISNLKSLPGVEDLEWDERREIWLASPMRAYEDMQALSRSTLDLVDMEELELAQAEFVPSDIYETSGANP